MRSRSVVVALMLLLSSAAVAHAKSYSAERFDQHVRVLRGGSLEVTETVVFRFDGTFTEVFRGLLTRRTDGLEVIRASMDETAFTPGKQRSQYEITRKNGLRVRWRFAPVADSTHTFELTYVVRGVVQQDDRGDLLAWQALPSKHDYGIATSRIDIDLAAAPVESPAVHTKRTAAASVGTEDTHVSVTASGIKSNGWVEVSILMPRGSVIDAPPVWQARRLQAATLAPSWFTAAGIILIVGFVVLFAVRQGYDSPSREPAVGATGPALPDAAPPAVAGALVANGRVGLEQAMATLFALADRGELSIVENRKRWGQPTFDVKRSPSSRPLTEYEQEVLDIAFTGRAREERTDLEHVRSRLTRRLKRFSRAVERQMIGEGLFDEGRFAVRNRYAWIGSVTLVAGLVAIIPFAIVVDQFGAWPLVVPLTIVAIGVIGLIMYAAHTPLSDEGIRRAREWRGLQKFLQEVTRDRATVPAGLAARLLPFAVTTGLASGWASYLKKHHEDVPAWFRALASDQGAQAFASFVAAGGTGAGHGGASGSGAAGGGSSGAH